MRLISLLITIFILGCSSVSVKDITELRAKPAVVFIQTATNVPHSRYEHNLLRRDLLTFFKNRYNLSVCINDIEESDKVADVVYLCQGPVMEYSEPSIDIRVTLEELKGVSNTGNVYNGVLEGTGEVSVTLDSTVKKYVLRSKGDSKGFAGLRLAKGLDRAITKIAEKIVDIVVDNFNEMTEN